MTKGGTRRGDSSPAYGGGRMTMGEKQNQKEQTMKLWRILFSVFMLFIVTQLQAQQLAQLRVVGKAEKIETEFVGSNHRDANGRICAMIKIISDMEGFQYDSYNGVVSVEDQPGQDLVFLSPDERVLEIFHEGYEPLKIILSSLGIQLASKAVWAIKINGEKKKNKNEVSGFGDVFIKTEPSRAIIFFDEKKIDQLTPTILKNIEAGRHFIKVTKEDLEGSTFINVLPNELNEIFIHLEKKKTVVKIYSDPVEAFIYINKKFFGKTPKILKELSPGEYYLELKKGEFYYSSNIKVSSEKPLELDVKLQKKSKVLVYSDPAQAQIYVDNNYLGITPIKLTIMPNKEYIIELKKDPYLYWQGKVFTKPGETKKIYAKLEKLNGKIILDTIPKNICFEINGKPVSVTNRFLLVPAGEVKVKLKKSGYYSKNLSFKILPNKEKILNVSELFKPKNKTAAFIRSFIFPGWGQSYKENTGRGWLYRLAFLSSVAGAYYFTNQYNKTVRDYNAIRKQYESAVDYQKVLRLGNQMESQYKKVEDNEKFRNYFYAAAAGIWLINVLDAAIMPPGWQRSKKYAFHFNKNGLQLQVSLR